MAKRARQFILILLGDALYALSVAMFTRPSGIPLGGVAGISMVINYLTSLPMGVMIIILNVPLFLISFRSLGKSFLLMTLISTVASSVFMDVFGGLLESVRITDNLILISLYGGLLSGAGLGIVFSQGSTTGGGDIAAKMIHKKSPHLSIGRINLVINVIVILASAAVFRSYEAALYSMIVTFVSSNVVDTIISGMDHASAALIVTSSPDEISAAVFAQMNRGCTGFASKGMYTQSDKPTLLVAVRDYEVAQLKRIILDIDGDAFLILLNAREVLGRGFKSYGQ